MKSPPKKLPINDGIIDFQMYSPVPKSAPSMRARGMNSMFATRRRVSTSVDAYSLIGLTNVIECKGDKGENRKEHGNYLGKNVLGHESLPTAKATSGQLAAPSNSMRWRESPTLQHKRAAME